MRCLIVDNYDSFTFNLYQLISDAVGSEAIVVRNDGISWDAIEQLDCDNIVLSPGPGRPERVEDFGVCADILKKSRAPVLGVCLGHQGLGHVYGGRVVHAPQPMHGRISRVVHDGVDLFAGLPQHFEVVRYHSLMLADPLPDELECIARTQDGIILGIRHRSRPLRGVQFHPESICTQLGARLIENFNALTLNGRGRRTWSEAERLRHSIVPASRISRNESSPSYEVRTRRLRCHADPEDVFMAICGQDDPAFWLDGALVDSARSRFSFMGTAAGPLAMWCSYRAASGELTIRRGGEMRVERIGLFEFLEGQLDRFRVAPTGLPFNFHCGFVGYIGYELRGECSGGPGRFSPHPDAQLIFADRLIAFDGDTGDVYLLALARTGETSDADAWLSATAARLTAGVPQAGRPEVDRQPVRFWLERSRERYLSDIEECLRYISDGESYEICLTNKVLADVELDPQNLYRILRRINPAPYSSYLRFGQLGIASSSPERFLAISHAGRVETKPIKGTCRRGMTPEEDDALRQTLSSDVKSRSENLMIADLLRNDLGMVSTIGSVNVPKLMDVETYQTVHQLVTTVRAQLKTDLTAVDCFRACFPGGSMTGAPKIRTMEIIDSLEQTSRGGYSGSIGYFSVDGSADFSIVIRTAVVDERRVSIGTGGAIVALSEPDDEFEETLLKAQAVMRAVLIAADTPDVEGALAAVHAELSGGTIGVLQQS
jgi:para-aminobenzoate synthetase